MPPADSPPTDDRSDDVKSWARQLATLGHVGTMFPVAIGIGFLGGWWLDGRLGTRPWLALLGFAFGVAAALRNLVRSVRELEESEAAAAAEDGSGESSARAQSSTYDDSP